MCQAKKAIAIEKREAYTEYIEIAVLAEKGVNIEDISQTILDEYFAMIMIVDMREAKSELSVIAQECTELGKQIGMSIYLQHEDIFNAMHSI